MTIITREILCENIVAADRIIAEHAAHEAIIARALADAPHSYAALKAANAARTLAALLAGMDAVALRLQAIRFLVEREQETGAAWGWGEQGQVAERFARLIAAWQAEQRALAQLELAQAVHEDAAVSAATHEEFKAAEEAHGAQADVYFARRAAREGLERVSLGAEEEEEYRNDGQPGLWVSVSPAPYPWHTLAGVGPLPFEPTPAERAAFMSPGRAAALVGSVVDAPRQLAESRRSIGAAAVALERIAAQVEAMLPYCETPGDDADQMFYAALATTDALHGLADLCRRALRAI
jgi:regulator of extracellular matrix RemA (YlzA/DUF370 family)